MGLNVGCILNLCLYPNFIPSSQFISTRKTRHSISYGKQLNAYMQKVDSFDTRSWEEWEYCENNSTPISGKGKVEIQKTSRESTL